jgi:hypothetical protein
MHLYHDKTLAFLKPEVGRSRIHYVGLGAYDFQFAFGNLVRVQNMLRVDFSIRGFEYTWEQGPCAIPAWLLIDQLPIDAVLESPSALRIAFQSGDWLRLHTEEGPYENQIFEWAGSDQVTKVMDIY